MKCQESKQKVYSLIDGELNSQEEQSLYGHLHGCASCIEDYNLARKTDKILEDCITHEAPPENFAAGVMARISGDPVDFESSGEHPADYSEKPGKRYIPLRWTAWVAGFILVAFLGASGLGLNGLQVALDFGGDPDPDRVVTPTGEGDDQSPDSEITGSPTDREPSHDHLAEGSDADETGTSGDSGTAQDEGSTDASREDDREAGGDSSAAPSGDEESTPSGSEDEAPDREPGEDMVPSSDGPLQAAWVTGNISSSALSFNGVESISSPHWTDNNNITFTSGEGGGYTCYKGSLNTRNSQKLFATGKSVSDISYGGDKIALVALDEKGAPVILAANVNNGDFKNITPADNGNVGSKWAFSPAVSSRGEVAFLTDRYGGINIAIAGDNSRVSQFTDTTHKIDNIAWSADGGKIAYYRYWTNNESGKQEGRIYVKSRSGGSATAVTPVVESRSMVASWSPSGDYLAVNVAGGPEQGVWRADTGNQNWEKLIDKGGGEFVAWSPDGRSVAFNDTQGAIYVLSGSSLSKPAVLFVPHTKGLPQDVNASWSPNGKRLVFERNGGTWLATLPDTIDNY